MRTLLHTPLSPFGRLARLVLAEKNLASEMVALSPEPKAQRSALEEVAPGASDDFLAPFVQPFGAPCGPVLVDDRGGAVRVIAGAAALCEFLEETVDGRALMPKAPAERAEARRLVAWAGDAFWREAVEPTLSERYLKSVFRQGAPDVPRMRAAAEAARRRLETASALIYARGWLAAETLSLADFALAAQISVLDYLGARPFGEAADPARDWYALIKSRPAFRGVLADVAPRLPPSAEYQELDF